MPDMDGDTARGTTARLAAWVHAARVGELPAPVRAHALRSFVNIVGCMIAGSRHPVIGLLEQTYAPYAGPATATLAGLGRQADVLQATLINGVSSGVDTFDDTHADAVVHPSGPVASAVLALAQTRHRSGADVLLAFTLGVEVLCRLGKALAAPPARGNMSWLQSCICAPPAVALAAGKLLDLDPERLCWAVGIAAAQASGLRGASGTLWSRVAPGEAAQLGVKAALLAARGVTGGTAGIEGAHGFASMFAHAAHLPALDGALGERHEILGNTFKPYPCGIVIHPAIDACRVLARDHGLSGAACAGIARIEVSVNPVALTLTDRPAPRDALQAQVSLQHWIAAVLVEGAAGLAQLEPRCLADPTVVALRARIVALSDPGLATDCARLRVTLHAGAVLEVALDHCIGSAARPMSDADLGAKFLDLTSDRLGAPAARALLAMCRELDRLPDVTALAVAMGGPATVRS